jgi:F420-0:gamma-glutamyl ligase
LPGRPKYNKYLQCPNASDATDEKIFASLKTIWICKVAIIITESQTSKSKMCYTCICTCTTKNDSRNLKHDTNASEMTA